MRKLSFLNITLILIIVNVLVFFAAMFLNFLFPNFIENYLALKPLDILQGKNLWTLVTSMFVHANLFHLFANMLSLMFLGTFLERLIGSKRFLKLYLAAGLLGSILFILLFVLFQDPRMILLSVFAGGAKEGIVAVGASGAIFGIAGMLAVLTPKLPIYIMFIPIAMPMWFGVLLILIVLSLIPGVANSAHLGGLIAGLIYAFYLKQKYKSKARIISNIFH